MTDAPKRKPRAPKPTLIERRLLDGAAIMKTHDESNPRGAFYTFCDTGRSARADVVERLIKAGRLVPLGDGLFAEESQTWALAPSAQPT